MFLMALLRDRAGAMLRMIYGWIEEKQFIVSDTVMWLPVLNIYGFTRPFMLLKKTCLGYGAGLWIREELKLRCDAVLQLSSQSF